MLNAKQKHRCPLKREIIDTLLLPSVAIIAGSAMTVSKCRNFAGGKS